MFTTLRSHRWAVPVLAAALIALGLSAEHLLNLPAVGSGILVAATLVAGARIATRAWGALRHRTIGIELLVTVAALGAIVIGEFWEAAAVTFLFAIGGALEATTLGKTRRALADLLEVAPAVAIVERDGEQVEVPAAAVVVGETVLVKAGAKVPVDGVVISGLAPIDEASITGESIPVEKDAGSQVFAGTISQGGFIRVEATGIGPDTTLARVIHRVEEAQEAKARAQTFMERFARWYTPGIMALALVAGLATGRIELALTLLVIGCPGALVISMPVSIVAGIGRAARSGILMRGGEHLEVAARVTAVAVDKTGTLTRGRPHLTDLIVLADPPALTRPTEPASGTQAPQPDDDGAPTPARASVTSPAWSPEQRNLLHWAAIAEAGSEHPLARPVLLAATAAGLRNLPAPDDVVPHPGLGIVAHLTGATAVTQSPGPARIAVGTVALMDTLGIEVTPEADGTFARLAAAGRTPMLVALDNTLLGALAVADEIRTDAAEMIDELHRVGVKKVVMLTGDDRRVAQAVATATGIDEVHAGLLPEDKLEAVRELQRAGYVVAMVGDGVNDAPALATADLGVAMGAVGSAVAIETADLALMSDNLLRLPEAIRLSRRTTRNMRQNVVIALATVILLLAGVLVGGVTMAVGMLVHQLSVLIVIVNGMRLLRARRDQQSGARDAHRGVQPPSPASERTENDRMQPLGSRVP